MPTVTSFEREKKEVESLLASGIFNRAPNLAHLLTYVCKKFFDGAAGEIKEYNIAVEALGRPPEFDQKRDSIVRVEAHRLRKRLKEYYEGDGASHEVQIQIPSGQYTPHFVIRNAAPETALVVAVPEPEWTTPAVTEDAPPAEPTSLVPVTEPQIPRLALPEPKRRRSGKWFWTTLAAAVLMGSAAAAWLKWERNPVPVHTVEVAPVLNSSRDIRILAGAETGSYVDAFERTWQSDRFYQGGYVTQSPRIHPVIGTRDHRLYQNRREGGFNYDIPLEPGVYELKLYFAETVFGDNNVAGGGETTRIFEVSMNGKPLLSTFDVINDAGSGAADVKVFKDVSPAPDGKLHLTFTPLTNPAFVNAIEIMPSVPGKMRPIRIVARDRGIKDRQNRYWDPDRYAQGGQLIARQESNVTADEPDLFRSERFGNITYTIPVPQSGRYGVTLYFAENWFGPGNPGGGGIGNRIFDVIINGVPVRRNFDILRESGGVGHSATVSLHGIEANHQGKIVIALTPARNYACVNALEIVDESK